jgi:hypothetical protein
MSLFTSRLSRRTILSLAGIRSCVSLQMQICDTVRCGRRIAKAMETWGEALPRGYHLMKDGRGVPYLALQDYGFLTGLNCGFERECHFTGRHNISQFEARWLQEDIATGFISELHKALKEKHERWLGLVYPRGISWADQIETWGFPKWDEPFSPETSDRCTYWYGIGAPKWECGCEACQWIFAAEQSMENLKREFPLLLGS